MGGTADRGGFSPEMYGLRASDHDRAQAGGEKYKKYQERRRAIGVSDKKRLQINVSYGMINNRDILI